MAVSPQIQELLELAAEYRHASEHGDSNDAEHDIALAMVDAIEALAEEQ